MRTNMLKNEFWKGANYIIKNRHQNIILCQKSRTYEVAITEIEDATWKFKLFGTEPEYELEEVYPKDKMLGKKLWRYKKYEDALHKFKELTK